MAKLTYLWYDNFGENCTPLQINGLAAIPKSISTSFRTTIDRNKIDTLQVSGGGSALLPAPKNPLTLDDKIDVIKALSQSGAIIQELNTVRY